MFRFAIDRGGTFTDVYAICPNEKIRVMKLLSVDPKNYEDAPREAIRRILEEELGDKFAKGRAIDSSAIKWIRMGTTVATNALLERKGEPIALVITKGFKDVLEIGTQARPKIFDLDIRCPAVLYSHVVEADERIVLRQDKCQIKKQCLVKTGLTSEEIEVWKELDLKRLSQDLQEVKKKGIESLAVALLHSYIYPDHENQIKKLATDMGFKHVSLSSEIMPMVKVVPRGLTTCADAYLTPHIQKYIEGFSKGFTNGLNDVNVLFMQSDGGLTPVHSFSGSRAILSGPAGGVVGFANTTRNDLATDDPIIGFDMGGTSTDVSRFDKDLELTFETTTAGVMIQAPQLDINTVAAGGGSMLFFRSGLFVVGPESAGAFPGPVCYRNGGPLTVTDANLCLGRIIPEYFPKIFGQDKKEPLDKASTINAFKKLTEEINSFMNESRNETEKKILTVEEVAMGFIRVANESMCRPIRAITQGKGYDTSKHILACFGGAGGQHACSIARDLGMSTVYIHKFSGILSAYGMALADVVHEETIPCAFKFEEAFFTAIEQRIKELKEKCVVKLASQGFQMNDIKTEVFLNMRYEKTDFGIMTKPNISISSNYCRDGDFTGSFLKQYQREFGFTIPNRKIIIDDIRVRGIGLSHINDDKIIKTATENPRVDSIVNCYFEETGYRKTPIYLLNELCSGHVLEGPCIIIDPNFTVLVEPECVAHITSQGNIKLNVSKFNKKSKNFNTLDPIQLSIFSHRFMSIAEQMGRVLQRTSISTNIKERLDFSCALFGPDGGLVSNAPHIPVHLGAMGETVKFQIKHLQDQINPGDVLLANHPSAGGSHLPDLTVITPVFYEGKIIFFVACRGHHADIGGLTPGSMPPHSKSLDEEGAAFISFKLVVEGIFQEEAVTNVLMSPGLIPGCTGTRALSDNLSDLHAQVAANQKGINLVLELIKEYGLEVVQSYMNYIQENAEISVREMLKKIAKNAPHRQLSAVDSMDDGTEIRLTVDIDGRTGNAIFDFSGTGLQVHGNCNAPKAVTFSAIIYCLRCMIGHEIPLNQGCLEPIDVLIPDGSILSPSKNAAVVGGNVLTSQRICDVIFKAFEACAASQGCMNNITFGDESFGYYETVGGGAGATPNSDGKSGIHTHMTNTRITDIEIIERRYPVIIQTYVLNLGSGGRGKNKGGDGLIREILFRKNLVLSVLTERRVFSPYSLQGGENGRRGFNLIKYKDGRLVNLGSKNSVQVNAGDVFHLETPGGGGFGDF